MTGVLAAVERVARRADADVVQKAGVRVVVGRVVAVRLAEVRSGQLVRVDQQHVAIWRRSTLNVRDMIRLAGRGRRDACVRRLVGRRAARTVRLDQIVVQVRLHLVGGVEEHRLVVQLVQVVQRRRHRSLMNDAGRLLRLSAGLVQLATQVWAVQFGAVMMQVIVARQVRSAVRIAQTTDVHPHNVKERSANEAVLDNERVEVGRDVAEDRAHDVVLQTRIAAPFGLVGGRRTGRLVSEVVLKLHFEWQNEFFQGGVCAARLGQMQRLQSLFQEDLDPRAHVGCDQMNETDAGDQLELVDHQATVGEDEVHLTEGERAL